MEIVSLEIPDVKLITPRRHGDNRGFFSEVYSRRALAAAGITDNFVQDNHSRSATVATLRGLHLQAPPHSQAKLIRVIKGRIFDVAVDVRRNSPSYGRHVTAELSTENWAQLYVPDGFLHGFLTLEPDTEVIYKVTSYYAPECERGVHWADPVLGIAWPLQGREPILSGKDAVLPPLSGMQNPY